jgi:exodeoxyribonuclease VII large subunit
LIETTKKVYSVSELTFEIKDLLEYNFENIYITGEISNFRVPASGHYYFTLKDDKAQIKAVMFRQTNIYMKFVPKDGMQILGRGRIGVYGPQGVYQVIFDHIEPAGVGALKQAFDDLKLKLEDEGLFDESRKKKLPLLLQKVGVVTSPTGAAIRDFLSVAKRRSSNMHITIYPVRVQGRGAAEEIVQGIKYFNRKKNVDAIVITRGGGSFEDLFCFSEEIVARTIYRSGIPVISAVGHEIDYSISDFVADLRAPTPSSAAELIITKKDELLYKISNYIDKLKYLASHRMLEQKSKLAYYVKALGEPKRKIDDLRLRIDDLTSHLITLARSSINKYQARIRLNKELLKRASPILLLEQKEKNIDMLQKRLKNLISEKMKYHHYILSDLKERLELANPYNLLKKGYSIVSLKETKRIVKSVRQLKEGILLDIKLGEGSAECKVTKIFEN